MNIDRSLRGSLLLLAASGVLAGCTPNDVHFGGAVRHNIEAQTVEPDPQYAGPAATSADKMAGAVERYRTDRVKQPVEVDTTSIVSSSSGSR